MKIVAILASVAFVITLAVNIFHKDQRVFNSEPYSTKLIKKADMFSNHFTKGANEEWASMPVGTAAAGTPVKVMEGYSKWYRISLPNGTMGWVQEENLQPSEGGLIRRASNKTVGVWATPEKKKGNLVTDVGGREWVTRLGHTSVKQSRGNWGFTKIKTSDGKVGWIDDYDIERVGWKQPRLIDKKIWRFDKSSFVSDWQGKPVEDFIKKFSEPDAIQNDKGNKIYTFNNIFLYDGDRKEIGIKAITKAGNIEEIGRTSRVTKWIGYFPLTGALRSSFVMNRFWDFFDLKAHSWRDKYGDQISEKYFSLPKWASIVLLILFIAMFLALFYVVLYVPYFVVQKIAYRISLNRKLKNGIILTIAGTGGAVLGYIYFMFIAVNIGVIHNWFIIFLLFAIGMTYGFIGKWKSDLLYNRCVQCRYWSGTDNGSDLVSRTHRTLTTTHSDGHRTREKGTQEVWLDHRLCANKQCGYAWDVVRTFWSGWH